MSAWLKKQFTEMTFWAGLYVIVSGFVNFPFWIDASVGVLLISIDDTIAAKAITKIAPFLSKKVDDIGAGK